LLTAAHVPHVSWRAIVTTPDLDIAIGSHITVGSLTALSIVALSIVALAVHITSTCGGY
jgi:hypothetical protein